MTVKIVRVASYLTGLADGYIRTPLSPWVHGRSMSAPSIEQAMAECFYREVAGVACPQLYATGQRRNLAPAQAHVWLVGSPEWINDDKPPMCRGPPLWRLLAGPDETRSEYRVLLWGVDISARPDAEPALLETWLDEASFASKSRSENSRFAEVAGVILTSLAKRYQATRLAPTSTIEDPRVKLAYAGGP